MADPYASFSTPVQSGDPYAAFSKPSGPVTGGGVQDYEPIVGKHIGTTELPQDEFANWLLTRARNAVTGAAQLFSTGGRFGRMAKPVPVQQELNRLAEPVIPTKNLHGSVGKMVDAGTEAAIGGLMLGGGGGSILPSFGGGAVSEGAGQITKGTPYEPAARVLGAVVGGGGTAIAQNVAGNVLRGVSNTLGLGGTDDTAARILAKNVLRDKMTMDDLTAAQANLGPGTPLVEAGGPNVRGMVRGAIAPPGEARTTMQEVFDARTAELPERASNALNRYISPNSSLASSVDDLNALRAQKATPAYEAAGVPDRPKMLRPERTVRFSVNEPPVTIPAEYNTPSFNSPRLDALVRDSADVQAAIAAARRLPEYKDLPQNTMSMLDKAYKHLVGLEQEAVRAGNGTRVHDLKGLRRDFGEAIAEVNPRYGRALQAYSGPSELIDASVRGREWFSQKVDPAIVRKEFQAMSPDQQQAALVGARDWARTAIDESRTGIPSEQVFGSAANKQRWEALGSTGDYNTFKKEMAGIKNTAVTKTDINVGSRTTPMALEANDNALAGLGPAATDLVRGRPFAAAGNALRAIGGRIAEGRTEAVNARIAEIARMTDPAQVGLVAALANRKALEEAARSAARQNALIYGASVPTAYAASGNRR